MTTIIAGRGEIGTAFGEVLADYRPYFYDIDPAKTSVLPDQADMLLICFPYSATFENDVTDLCARFRPANVVIHSTVTPGVSRRLGASFSPVVGIHPHLEESLRVFKRFIAGPEASAVADYYRRAGLRVEIFDKQETLELAKLQQTNLYGLIIEFVKDHKRLCDALGVSFAESYTLFNADYSAGYAKLGYSEFCLPLLQPIMKRIGAHCVLPNAALLDTEFTKLIRKLNADPEQKID